MPSYTVPRRAFGKTGEQVSIIGMGGFHLGATKDQQEANAMVGRAIDAGINFFDNAWEYKDGLAEERLGTALKGKRDPVSYTHLGFAGSEGDVVVRVKDGEHAIAGGFAAELEVGHEGDGFARIGQGDGEAEARTRLVCIGPGGGIVVAGNGGAERNGGKHVERGEVVRLLRVGFPVEVAGENLAL